MELDYWKLTPSTAPLITRSHASKLKLMKMDTRIKVPYQKVKHTFCPNKPNALTLAPISEVHRFCKQKIGR